jgi:alkylhydroperoxidase/carboxymuconolactone decarboxylase family protein YurZ
MKPTSKVIAKMRRERRGQLASAFEFLDGVDREYLEAYNRVAVLNFNYGDAGKGRALDARMKELIAVALLATIRGETTRKHMARALEEGATPRQVVEALEVAMHICGAPALEFGLRLLQELQAER